MSKFVFFGNHPHKGEMCTPRIEEELLKIGGETMWPWNIINCSHGTEWCYATKVQTREVMTKEEMNEEL